MKKSIALLPTFAIAAAFSGIASAQGLAAKGIEEGLQLPNVVNYTVTGMPEGAGNDSSQSVHSASWPGTVYLFAHSGVVWSRQSYLKIFEEQADDEGRFSVAVGGDKVVDGVIDEGGSGAALDSICSIESHARQGQIAPNTGGGRLDPRAYFDPTTINSSGSIAFNSRVDGSLRNQGVFVADSSEIRAIAIGCGGGGGSGNPGPGCGDPAPIGGTFGGFFSGTLFTPDINDAGDVLFLCEVVGGSSTRGLFLYRATTQQIIKVAAVGDPSPIGGTFDAVGPGSLNNNGRVVFLASPAGTTNSNIFMWHNGTVTKVAAIGDAAPGGGTFSLLGTESLGFVDGTNIPIGPVPDINDMDQICFRAIVSGGVTTRGLIVRTGTVDHWYVKVPDPTPAGGAYVDMQAASINNTGQIAFFADYRPTPTTFNSGWFAGAPGNWRKVVVFLDPVDGGQCNGLAFSRNPMQTINSAGEVLFWTDLDANRGADRLMLGLANGSLLVAGRRGQPAPIGGTFGPMDAWPAVSAHRGTLNASTPGAIGGATSAHMVFKRCTSVLGDVNGDAVVNSTDALIILSCDVGLNTAQFCPMNCGEVNADGVVNSTDALIVLSYDVGLSVPFPVGQGGCNSGVAPCPGCLH